MGCCEEKKDPASNGLGRPRQEKKEREIGRRPADWDQGEKGKKLGEGSGRSVECRLRKKKGKGEKKGGGKAPLSSYGEKRNRKGKGTPRLGSGAAFRDHTVRNPRGWGRGGAPSSSPGNEGWPEKKGWLAAERPEEIERWIIAPLSYRERGKKERGKEGERDFMMRKKLLPYI